MEDRARTITTRLQCWPFLTLISWLHGNINQALDIFHIHAFQNTEHSYGSQYYTLLFTQHGCLFLWSWWKNCNRTGNFIFQFWTHFYLIKFLKESLTGLVGGLSYYIHNHAPAAVGMPCIAYDHYFTHPWATKIEHEDRHRELTRAVGQVFKGGDDKKALTKS